MTTQTYNLADVMLGAFETRLANFWVAIPGIVQAYNPTKQTVDVQPAIYASYTDESGDVVPERLPVVPGCPVAFPGAGAYSITFPIKKGDTCMLAFQSGHIDKWIAYGGEVDPQDYRRHHIGDAIAIFSPRDYAHAITPAPSTSALQFNAPDEIDLTAPVVRVGGADATGAIVVQSALDTFVDALTTAIGTLGANPAAAALSALKTALGSWSAGTTNGKAK